jgi:CDGSH-type Zn-finger protein
MASPLNSAHVRANGPLLVQGALSVHAPDGTLLKEDVQVALCRCGQSGNKPFCDGSHARTGFRDAGLCSKPEPIAAVASGALAVNPIANGPLTLVGPLELHAADGQVIYAGEKCWLCRCGNSGNKPFCDGTHKKIGFVG